MPDVFKSRDTSVWIQTSPGVAAVFLGDCIDIDSIPNPQGVPGLIVCWNRQRDGFVTRGETIEPPGNLEYSLTELVEQSASYLEGIDCPFTLFALQKGAGPAGIFNNWIRGVVVQNNRFSNDTFNNVASRESDEALTHDYDLSGWIPRIDVRTITVGALTVTELNNIYWIDACKALSCVENIDKCDQFVAGASSTIPGAGTANVIYANDGTTIQTAAADPHAVDEDLIAGVCFPWYSGGVASNRWLVARETAAATVYELAISDDEGATWAIIEVGTTATEFAPGPNSIFALDGSHIWISTDQGNIYFSSDGGTTWDDQNALGASGANSLNCIHFADTEVGYAVGDADTVIWTDNGGATWTAATATGLGVALDSVVCFSRYRAIIGSAIIAAGSLVMTFDGGETYARRIFTGDDLEGVAAISFANNLVGTIVTNTAGILGSIHMTIDGGASWFELAAPTNLGFTDVTMCNPNEFYASGLISAGVGVVVRGIG